MARETKKHRRANGSTFRHRAAISSGSHQLGAFECARLTNGQFFATHSSASSIGGRANPLDITARLGVARPNDLSISKTISDLPDRYLRTRLRSDGLTGRGRRSTPAWESPLILRSNWGQPCTLAATAVPCLARNAAVRVHSSSEPPNRLLDIVDINRIGLRNLASL